MKLMKTVLATCVAACALGTFAETNAPGRVRKPFKDLTPEEQEAMFQARITRQGGMLERPGSGEVRIFDWQDAVPESSVKEMFMLSSSCPIKVPFKHERKQGRFSIAGVPKAMSEAGVKAAVFLVDDPSLPMTLCAMEASWGVVNVAPLKADSPKPQLLFQRLNKLFTRVATVTFGGTHQPVTFSALQSVTTLKELDEMGAFAIAPMCLTMMSDHLPKLGVTFPYLTTYKRACREGWAPAPTNDVQKAIWEKIKADKERGPTNPITISPPNAKK